MRILIVFLLITAPVFAANHYIRPGASGNNSGSDWTNACTGFTGSCAVSAMVRGDAYYFSGGSYASVNFNKAASGATIITLKKATISDHGTDAGWSNTYDTQAQFDTQINFGTSYWIFDCQQGGGPNSLTSGFGCKVSSTAVTPLLRTDQVSNITIRHIEAAGNNNSNGGGSIAQDGLASFGGTFVTLSYFYIHDTGRCPFFLSVQDFVAEYGYVGTFVSTADAHAEVASIWNFAIPANRVTFRYNVFTHSDGTGGLMFDNSDNPTGGGMQVYGNVIYHPPDDVWSGGNGFIGSWTVSGFNDVLVYNNTFIGVTDMPTLGELATNPQRNVAYNNLFYNCNAPNFTLFQTHDYDGFYSSGNNAGESNGQVGTGNPFVNISGLDFHLTAHTTAGITLAAPYDVDPDGVSRGASGNWDRGAFEYTAATIDTTNITGAFSISGEFSLQ